MKNIGCLLCSAVNNGTRFVAEQDLSKALDLSITTICVPAMGGRGLRPSIPDAECSVVKPLFDFSVFNTLYEDLITYIKELQDVLNFKH